MYRDKLIDLHLHLDGALSLNMTKKLAAIQGMELPEKEEEIKEMITVSEGCRDLNEFLAKFDFPIALLQTKESISECAYLLKEELKEEGLIYAEMRFAPQSFCKKGLTQEEVIEAILEGDKKSDLKANYILCCMRGTDNFEANMETIKLAEKYLGKGICAVDLAGAEALFPTADYRELFAYAKEHGVPYTVHAGEADGPESVKSALSFGTKRIGHGVRAAEDINLVRRLAEEQTVLEMCPTSNLHTSIFKSIQEYPLRELMNAGVKITINTDDKGISGINLWHEFEMLKETFALTDEELRGFLLNSVDASFASEEWKKELRKYYEA